MSRRYWRVFLAIPGADLRNAQVDAQAHQDVGIAPETLEWNVDESHLVRGAFEEEREFNEKPQAQSFSYFAALARAVVEARKLTVQHPLIKDRVYVQFIHEGDGELYIEEPLTAKTNFFSLDKALDI